MKYMILVLLIACSSRPQLYPNQKLKTVGKEASKKDVDACIKDAEDYIDSSEGKKILKGAGSGALIGAAMGGALGLFTGNLGGGLARGGAIGAAGGGTAAAISPNQLKQRYVNQCLADKGYQVIGWD
jgi:outer membrane lipoprotein SlyB